MNNFTIANDYVLPSKGLVYTADVDPNFKLRSMTTLEEMKRLNYSDKPNKNIAEIIDDCLVEGIGISAYDLCLPDFQYVLNKLRIVTYGPSYTLASKCPWCGSQNTNDVDLDSMSIIEFDEEEYKKYVEFELPQTKKMIKIRPQTPRILDNISVRVKEAKIKKIPLVGDITLLYTLESLIASIDDRVPERHKVSEFVKNLPMMDTNYILKSADKLNELFGLDKQLRHTCSYCGLDYTGSFRITTEFFGPTIDR